MDSIPSNGIHEMPDKNYFAIDLPSSSTTKPLLSKTNAHVGWDRENPQTEHSDAFSIGALVHALVLTPDSIEESFIRHAKLDKRTKEGKAEWESLTKRSSMTGARLIDDEQWADAERMANAIAEHRSCKQLLSLASLRERSVIGDVCGRPAKCKIDAMSDDLSVIVDIKTCLSASPTEFSRSAAAFGYAHQAAFYRRMVCSLDNPPKRVDFVFVCVEKTSPNLVAVYRLADAAIDLADKRIDEVVARWWAVKEGDRSGYPTEITDIDLPAWAYKTQGDGNE